MDTEWKIIAIVVFVELLQLVAFATILSYAAFGYSFSGDAMFISATATLEAVLS
jgi:hypothetical protein